MKKKIPTQRSLEAEANRSIDLKQFIPLASVDPVYFENTHYLGADKGGAKHYRLLAEAMAKSGRVAIAELVSRGKEQLVLIRPYKNGLVLHTLYYWNEVRDFKQVPKGENVKVSQQELELDVDLIEKLSAEEFHPENYKDEYRTRVLAMLDEKGKGKEDHCSHSAATWRQSREHYGSSKAQHVGILALILKVFGRAGSKPIDSLWV